MSRRLQISMQLTRGTVAAAVLLAALAGMAMGAFLLSAVQSQAEPEHGGAEVRVNVRALEDGRVEVGMQQLGSDGEWGERQLPTHRFLPADAPPEWRNSSSIQLEPPAAMTDAMGMTDGMGEETTAMPAPFGPIPPTAADAQICWISHGGPGDLFWATARSVTGLIAVDGLGLQGLTIESAATSAEQAAAIRRCADDGMKVIVTTLADPEGLRDAIAYARSAGVVVTSFNAGADAAAELGSIVHLEINNHETGVRLGEQFAARELEGNVLCVLHESRNVSLVERCEGIAEGYGDHGEVMQLDVSATGVADLAGSAAAIGDELAANPYVAVVVLNQGLAAPLGQMTAAIKAGGGEIVAATYAAIPQPETVAGGGGNGEVLYGTIGRGQIDYFVFDQAPLQGYLAAVSAYYMQWVSTFVDLRNVPSIQIELSSLIYDEDALWELAYGASSGN